MTEYLILVRHTAEFPTKPEYVERDVRESLEENGLQWLEVISVIEVD